MGNETTFNKELFVELLERAKGEDRSINQYANDTGVSAAHISRFLRQMIEAPPTPETLSKFADKARGGVTYRDMMIAAGYIIENNDKVAEDSPRNRMEELRKIEQEIFQIILTFLTNSDYKWSMDKPGGSKSIPDMVFNLEDNQYKKWYFDIKVFRKNTRSMPPTHIIYTFYGRLLTFELTSTDKFTLVVNDEKAFDFMLKRPPVNLRANLYVMLVDLENRKVVREEQISEY